MKQPPLPSTHVRARQHWLRVVPEIFRAGPVAAGVPEREVPADADLLLGAHKDGDQDADDLRSGTCQLWLDQLMVVQLLRGVK